MWTNLITCVEMLKAYHFNVVDLIVDVLLLIQELLATKYAITKKSIVIYLEYSRPGTSYSKMHINIESARPLIL